MKGQLYFHPDFLWQILFHVGTWMITVKMPFHNRRSHIQVGIMCKHGTGENMHNSTHVGKVHSDWWHNSSLWFWSFKQIWVLVKKVSNWWFGIQQTFKIASKDYTLQWNMVRCKLFKVKGTSTRKCGWDFVAAVQAWDNTKTQTHMT
jgi:hypothetical protein